MDGSAAGTTLKERHDSESLTIEDEGERPEAGLPPAVAAAAQGRVKAPGQEEVDATDWLMALDLEAPLAIKPTRIRLNIGQGGTRRYTHWEVQPLPGEELRRIRQIASGGNRAMRRAASAGQIVNEMDDQKYHLLVVASATVRPDLAEVAKAKRIDDPVEYLRLSFISKPGLLAQISGVVSDISGYDETDVEVVAGN